MREAIDKQSALELLKIEYPSFDERTINRLYEELKGGLYNARNHALAPIGDVKRRIEEEAGRQDSNPAASRTHLLRQTLMSIKSDFESITSFKPITAVAQSRRPARGRNQRQP